MNTPSHVEYGVVCIYTLHAANSVQLIAIFPLKKDC